MLLLFFIGIQDPEVLKRRASTILQSSSHVNTLTRKRYRDIKDDLDAKLRAETERQRRERRKKRDERRYAARIARQALIDERKDRIDGAIVAPPSVDTSIAQRVNDIMQMAQRSAAIAQAQQLSAQDEDEAIALLLLGHG